MMASAQWPLSPNPLVILAPMDGYTDRAFRRFVKQIEPRCIVFTEFLSSTEIAKKHSLAKQWLQISPLEQPLVVQLYGKDPDHFRVAAMCAEEQGAAGIDLNMGCPARRVVAHQHGSALMKNIDLACQIVEKVKKSVSCPVSVKTRLGWGHADNLIPFGIQLQDAGLDAITIHGRTYEQKFQGEADWSAIYRLKDALDIPVFGNGDVRCESSALSKIGNLNGVMVGRGAVENPYLLRRICHAFSGTHYPNHALPFADQLNDWNHFVSETIQMGDELSMARRLRKYLIRLVDEHAPTENEFKKMARKVTCQIEIEELLTHLAEQPAFAQN